MRAGNIGYSSVLTGSNINYVSINCVSDFCNENIYAAKNHAKILSKQKFNTYEVDVVAGDSDTSKNSENMFDFISGRLDVAVTTRPYKKILQHKNVGTVVVEDADRFSLVQLSNIRSLIPADAKLVLVKNSKNKQIEERLNLFAECSDINKLFASDAKFAASGHQIPKDVKGSEILKIVDILRDSTMAKYATFEACKIFEADPKLKSDKYNMLGFELSRSFA